MFRVIVVIMCTFLVCRLPTWVYLLYKLDNVANTNAHWVLQYVFGIISIFNGVLNPLLYTFLTETIQMSFVLFDRLKEMVTCGRKSVSVEEGLDRSNEDRPKFYFSEDQKAKTARVN